MEAVSRRLFKIRMLNRIFVEKSVAGKSEFIQELEDQFDSQTHLTKYN